MENLWITNSPLPIMACWIPNSSLPVMAYSPQSSLCVGGVRFMTKSHQHGLWLQHKGTKT